MNKQTTALIMSSADNKTPRRCSEKLMEKIIKDSEEMISHERLFVVSNFVKISQASIENIVGIVTKLFIKNGDLYADVKFLDTPAFKTLESTVDKLKDFDISYWFGPVGYGNVISKKGKREEYDMDYSLSAVYIKSVVGI